MRRECRERFPRHRLQRKPRVSDPDMHHDTCGMHVPWCMSGSLTRGGGENVPGIPGACAIRNFTYLVRGPCAMWPQRFDCTSVTHMVCEFCQNIHIIQYNRNRIYAPHLSPNTYHFPPVWWAILSMNDNWSVSWNDGNGNSNDVSCVHIHFHI